MGYFRQLPNFDYVSRLNDPVSSSDYIEVKNLFKRGKVRKEFFQNFTAFDRYMIIGDERPDNVAEKLYDDPELDWVILYVNNIINVRDEWPLSQASFERFLINKYGSVSGYNAAHHYETTLVKDSGGSIIIPEGMEVNSDFSVTYRDSSSGSEVIASSITTEITNKAYEEKLQDIKRQIYILRPAYLSIVLEDIDEMMIYTPSSQFVNEKLVKGDNIKIK